MTAWLIVVACMALTLARYLHEFNKHPEQL